MPAGSPDGSAEGTLLQMAGCLAAVVVGGIALIVVAIGIAIGAAL